MFYPSNRKQTNIDVLKIYIYLFIYFIACICAYVEVRGQLEGVSSLHSPCGFQTQVSGLAASAFTTEQLASPAWVFLLNLCYLLIYELDFQIEWLFLKESKVCEDAFLVL